MAEKNEKNLSRLNNFTCLYCKSTLTQQINYQDLLYKFCYCNICNIIYTFNNEINGDLLSEMFLTKKINTTNISINDWGLFKIIDQSVFIKQYFNEDTVLYIENYTDYYGGTFCHRFINLNINPQNVSSLLDKVKIMKTFK